MCHIIDILVVQYFVIQVAIVSRKHSSHNAPTCYFKVSQIRLMGWPIVEWLPILTKAYKMP